MKTGSSTDSKGEYSTLTETIMPPDLLHIFKTILSQARFLKRLSVAGSLVFGVTNLMLGGFMGLTPHMPQTTRERMVKTTMIINFVALALAAVTSLDWRDQRTQDKQFADQLMKIAPRIEAARGSDWYRAPRDGADYV